jgi:hypothetical protein
MSINIDYKKLTILSLKENIITVEFCINFNKSHKHELGIGENGCLGFPAIILLSSIIDTIGSYFEDTETTIKINGKEESIKNVLGHFYILNHEKLFNLNLDIQTISDFYVKYRSPLTHNNTLPPNTSIDLGNETEDIFEINDKKEVTQVRLIPLLMKVKESVNTFIYYLETANWSAEHKLQTNLEDKGNESGIESESITLTGSTITNFTKL